MLRFFILLALIFSVKTHANELNFLKEKKISATIKIRDIIKLKKGRMFSDAKEVNLTSIVYYKNKIIGCSNIEKNLFFKDGVIPTKEKIYSCQNLSDLVKCLGLPVASNGLSSGWTLGDEHFDVKFWLICNFSNDGIPVEILLVGAQVQREVSSKVWKVSKLEIKKGTRNGVRRRVRTERGQRGVREGSERGQRGVSP